MRQSTRARRYFGDRERRRGNAKGCGIKGVTNQALYNVLHPFSPCSITIRIESVSVRVRTTTMATATTASATHSTTTTGRSISLTKTHLVHSHIHAIAYATAPRSDKQSRFHTLSLFFSVRTSLYGVLLLSRFRRILLRFLLLLLPLLPFRCVFIIVFPFPSASRDESYIPSRCISCGYF